jgi:hypothetical protein
VLDLERMGAQEVSDMDLYTVADDSSSYGLRAWGCAGDVTGDGLDDLFVGYTPYDSGEYTGSLALFEGTSIAASVSIADYEAIWSGPPETISGLVYFGRTCAANGDHDGDGTLDLLAGNNTTEEASVFTDARAGGLYTDADLVVDATALDPYFWGGDLVYLPDVDGDGTDEIALGGQADYAAGGAAIVPGGLTGAASLDDGLILGGRSISSGFGLQLAAGDVDHDGVGDLVVAAEGDDAGASAAGAVFLFLGADLAEP